MILDIDISPYCIQNDTLGQIAPYYLSGGVFYSNKWFKDKSMPFRLKHNTQLKFIKSLGFNNIIKDPQSLYLNWLNISANILALTPRAKHIKDTLRYRLENINNFVM